MLGNMRGKTQLLIPSGLEKITDHDLVMIKRSTFLSPKIISIKKTKHFQNMFIEVRDMSTIYFIWLKQL